MAAGCDRCKGTGKLLSGASCPNCTHEISWNFGQGGNRARIAVMHRVSCSCGWRHMETSRQNALGRASKMRGAVTRHLNDVAAKEANQ